MPDKDGASLHKGFQYQYWMVVLNLLKLGIPFEVIESLSDVELSTILGLTSALSQIEQETMEREQRQSARM